MLRRFAPDYDRPSPAEQREWQVGKMFDEDGRPLQPETALIIKEFFENPHAIIPAMIISRRTQLNPFLIRSFCRQMGNVDILREDPPLSMCFVLQSSEANPLIEKIRLQLRQGHGE